MEDKMKAAQKSILPTYARNPVVLERGEGVYVYDTNGREYLDFAAGIAVCALGYGNKALNGRIKKQVDKMVHTSNYFYNEPAIEAAGKLAAASGMDRVFFTNSGTEAVEGALKLARKYGRMNGNEARYEIVAMNQAFHGRSMGALSVTGTVSYREPFEPLVGGVTFADFNDFDSVKAAVNGNTCAVILEVVQGEGGLHVANGEFLQKVRKLCDDLDVILIFDEVQCGMGRTGEMFAYQNYGVLPDVITCAKGLGCGMPVGAFAVREKLCGVLAPGDHGSTYGGNPLVTEAVSAVFDVMESERILDNVKEVGAYLKERLTGLLKEKENVLEHRGMGLMQGLVLRNPVGEIVGRALENGLVVISAGGNVLRLVPPLIITKENVDAMMDVLTPLL